MDCDQDLATLYGYYVTGDLIGVNIKKLIPALELPTSEKMSKVCIIIKTVAIFLEHAVKQLGFVFRTSVEQVWPWITKKNSDALKSGSIG